MGDRFNNARPEVAAGENWKAADIRPVGKYCRRGDCVLMLEALGLRHGWFAQASGVRCASAPRSNTKRQSKAVESNGALMDASPTRAEVAAGGKRKRDTSRRRPQRSNFFRL